MHLFRSKKIRVANLASAKLFWGINHYNFVGGKITLSKITLSKIFICRITSRSNSIVLEKIEFTPKNGNIFSQIINTHTHSPPRQKKNLTAFYKSTGKSQKMLSY